MTYYRLYIHFKEKSIYGSRNSICTCADCSGNIFKFINIEYLNFNYYITSICIDCNMEIKSNIDAYNIEKFKTEIYNKLDWITV